jgi:hypothetical protein
LNRDAFAPAVEEDGEGLKVCSRRKRKRTRKMERPRQRL